MRHTSNLFMLLRAARQLVPPRRFSASWVTSHRTPHHRAAAFRRSSGSSQTDGPPDSDDDRVWRESVQNIKTVLGIDVSALDHSSRHATSIRAWLPFNRGRCLFIPRAGLGGFNITSVLEEAIADFPTASDRTRFDDDSTAHLPTPHELQARAYFPRVTSPEPRRAIARLLKEETKQDGALFLPREYLLRNHGFFDDEARANRLDELEHASRIEGAAQMNPRALLNRISEWRETQDWGPDVKYEWLDDAPRVRARLPAIGEVELKVLGSSHEIFHAGQALSNCAADYSKQVESKRCILVAMFSTSSSHSADGRKAKALALGSLRTGSLRWEELDDDTTEWEELSGHSNSSPS